eukprot:12918595-Prorocentrum_lima.AAC.1
MLTRADGATRRTSPYKVELLLGYNQQDPDFNNLEEETPLTALKIQHQARGADIVAALQYVDDPAVLRNLAWDAKKKRGR